ncbi:MAG TPA: universal stress protein [Puia sp.]|uniref:universal stress protein n=1 Tax=Puia sp. TaxID=2045100 RepID=UPI002C857518|nr:universal stress protein [Puia sp.]HVU94136.1 universal stress protein [Puia sp.]
MKKILIATDLSPAARNAADWGVRLAKAFDAGVILASAFEQMPIPVTEAPVILNAEDMRVMVQRDVANEAELIKGDGAVPIEAMACEGSATPAMLRVVRARQADWIVVGMKGSGRELRRAFGSTVTGLGRKAGVPLLIIPEGVRFSPPKAIAMAVDVYTETGFSIPAPVRELAEKFHSKLFIIRLFNKGAGEVIEILHQTDGGNRTIGAFSPLCEMPAGESVTDALSEYIDASPIDLLVMKPHPRMGPERWFLRSETRQMIFKTHVPMLVLPGEPAKNDVS